MYNGVNGAEQNEEIKNKTINKLGNSSKNYQIAKIRICAKSKKTNKIKPLIVDTLLIK